jgi:hypothetical protein
MIRAAKSPDGWLCRSPSYFLSWARLNSIDFEGVRSDMITPQEVEGWDGKSNTPPFSKGLGLVATRNLEPVETRLVVVPRDSGLILRRESVLEMSRADSKLAELLESCGEFAMVSRHLAKKTFR